MKNSLIQNKSIDIIDNISEIKEYVDTSRDVYLGNAKTIIDSLILECLQECAIRDHENVLPQSEPSSSPTVFVNQIMLSSLTIDSVNQELELAGSSDQAMDAIN